MEKWKNVNGYEGLYLVSDQGRIKSIERNGTKAGGQIMKGTVIKEKGNEYRVVKLRDKGRIKLSRVHRIVAIAFLGFPPDDGNKWVVDHIDGNKTNNKLSNLQWLTNRDNVMKGLTKEVAVKVKQYSNSGKLLNEFTSLKEAERKTGYSVYFIRKNSVKEFKFVCV